MHYRENFVSGSLVFSPLSDCKSVILTDVLGFGNF